MNGREQNPFWKLNGINCIASLLESILNTALMVANKQIKPTGNSPLWLYLKVSTQRVI